MRKLGLILLTSQAGEDGPLFINELFGRGDMILFVFRTGQVVSIQQRNAHSFVIGIASS